MSYVGKEDLTEDDLLHHREYFDRIRQRAIDALIQSKSRQSPELEVMDLLSARSALELALHFGDRVPMARNIKN